MPQSLAPGIPVALPTLHGSDVPATPSDEGDLHGYDLYYLELSLLSNTVSGLCPISVDSEAPGLPKLVGLAMLFHF